MAKIIYSKSFTKFLLNSDGKIADLLYRLSRKKRDSLIVTDKYVNYITFRSDGTISYLPAGKEQLFTDDGEWKREGRQNAKPAKVIKKLLSPRAQKWFKDSDYECFTNEYKARYCPEGYKFELQPNTSIPDVYCMPLESGDCSLNNSCMNGDRSYLELYYHCKKLKILTLKNPDGELSGRALVWDVGNGITFMDRIYIAKDYMYDMFLSYAKEHNWYRKLDYKSYDNKADMVSPDGEEKEMRFKIETDTDFDYYPYIDTFTYGNDGELQNTAYCTQYEYTNTDGSRDGESRDDDDDDDDDEDTVYSGIEERYIRESDASIVTAGEERYRHNYVLTDHAVFVDGELYYKEDSNIVEIRGRWFRKLSDSVCLLENGEFELKPYCSYSVKFGWLRDSECVYSKYHNDYIPMDNAVYARGGDWFLTTDIGKVIQKQGREYVVEAA